MSGLEYICYKFKKMLSQTWEFLEPLGLSVKNDEDVVDRYSRERDGKADPCVDWIGVEREEDHEEAGEGENCRDEDWDLREKREKQEKIRHSSRH